MDGCGSGCIDWGVGLVGLLRWRLPHQLGTCIVHVEDDEGDDAVGYCGSHRVRLFLIRVNIYPVLCEIPGQVVLMLYNIIVVVLAFGGPGKRKVEVSGGERVRISLMFCLAIPV